MPDSDFWFFDPRFEQAIKAYDNDLDRETQVAIRFNNLYRLRHPDKGGYGWEHSPLDAMEHEALARYLVNSEPKTWLPMLPLAIPAYAAKKALGLKPGATPATLEQIVAGYKGYVSGLLDVAQEKHPKEWVPDILQRMTVSPGYAVAKGILEIPETIADYVALSRN